MSKSTLVTKKLRSLLSGFTGFLCLYLGLNLVALAQEVVRPMTIRQYRVTGSKHLDAKKVQAAVYPFLGPGRLPVDVDRARSALEKAYHDLGYRAVSVSIPVQRIRQGVVYLQVDEHPIGRVRVRGAQYTSPGLVREQAKSLQEGALLDFEGLTRDNIAMNQSRDRKVTPDIIAGKENGTFDVILKVEDKLPLHGNIELNNRYSDNTTEWRVNGSVSYENLWQRGHTLGFSFQTAPENTEDAQVYSAFYMAPLASPGWSWMLNATKQDSNVSTLGGLAVAGRGDILGFRLIRTLPATEHYYHSVSFGVDRKDYDEQLIASTGSIQTPILLYPFSLQYTGSLQRGKSRYDWNAGIAWHVRGWGADSATFANKRYGSQGSFIVLRSDVTWTHDFVNGLQGFAKLQSQLSSQPLINSEQFAAGGLGSVRGFLESEALGDDAVFATLELRSPRLFSQSKLVDDMRVHGFVEGGVTRVQQALVGQSEGEGLASVGLGARGRFAENWNTSIDTGYPLTSRPSGHEREIMSTFRFWLDF